MLKLNNINLESEYDESYTNDEYGKLKDMNAIESKNGSGVQTLVLNNCRHSPYTDQQEVIIKTIKGFVKDLT